MESILKQIGDILQEEKDIYRDILELSRKKTDVILEGKTAELNSIVKTEESLILRAGHAAQKREASISYLRESLGHIGGEITLDRLIKLARGEVREKLSAIHREFNSIIEEQKKLNDLNGRLIKNNLEYIDISINTMTGTSPSDSVYNLEGNASQKNQKFNLIDRRV